MADDRTSGDGPRMQATLIRFGPELFLELKREAKRNGVSVAQYVREAVVARMAYTAGQRGDPRYQLGEVDGASPSAVRSAAARARAAAQRVRSESRAVQAESSQAQDQSRRVAGQSARHAG